MENENDWDITPEESYQAIEQGFLQTIAQRAASVTPVDDLAQNIKSQQAEIELQRADWVKMEPKLIEIQPFTVSGISARTLNSDEAQPSKAKLPGLWG